MPADARVSTWSELSADCPMPLLERRRVIGEQAMISHILLKKGCDVPLHKHENEQFSAVLSGKVRFVLGDPGTPQHREVIVGPGQILHLPSNLPHSAFAVEETVVLDIFSPPSATTGIDRKPDAHG